MLSLLVPVAVVLVAAITPILIGSESIWVRTDLKLWTPRGRVPLSIARWKLILVFAIVLGLLSSLSQQRLLSASAAETRSLESQIATLTTEQVSLSLAKDAETDRASIAAEDLALQTSLASATQEKLDAANGQLSQLASEQELQAQVIAAQGKAMHEIRQSSAQQLHSHTKLVEQLERDRAERESRQKERLEQMQTELETLRTAVQSAISESHEEEAGMLEDIQSGINEVAESLQDSQDSSPPDLVGPKAPEESPLPVYNWIFGLTGGSLSSSLPISMDKKEAPNRPKTNVNMSIASWGLHFNGTMRGRTGKGPTATFPVSEGRWKAHELRITLPTDSDTGIWSVYAVDSTGRATGDPVESGMVLALNGP